MHKYGFVASVGKKIGVEGLAQWGAFQKLLQHDDKQCAVLCRIRIATRMTCIGIYPLVKI